MATESVATLCGKDWLGTHSHEVQFFVHSSSTEPLSLISVKDTSHYTIQVRAKSLAHCCQVCSQVCLTCNYVKWFEPLPRLFSYSC